MQCLTPDTLPDQRDRARHRRPSSGQGGIKNPEFKRVREDLWWLLSDFLNFRCTPRHEQKIWDYGPRLMIWEMTSRRQTETSTLLFKWVVFVLLPSPSALFWCWMRQQSEEVVANNIWLIAGVCQELRIRHRKKREESGGEKAFQYSGPDKGLMILSCLSQTSVQTF